MARKEKTGKGNTKLARRSVTATKPKGQKGTQTNGK